MKKLFVVKIRNLVLPAATALLAAGCCTKRPVQPQFEVMALDSLAVGKGITCIFDYRFATIRNARSSPALKAIERANIGYFFELEEFSGSAREAASAAMCQSIAEMMPPANNPEAPGHPDWQFEISAESEGSVVDTLLCYSIVRSSYTGGAHGIYGTECHVYSLTGGYEVSLADLFGEEQLKCLDRLIRDYIRERYDARNDDELEARGFFPDYIRATENFTVTPEGITFFYNPYEIGCYALGTVEVTVGRDKLAGLRRPAGNEKRSESHD